MLGLQLMSKEKPNVNYPAVKNFPTVWRTGFKQPFAVIRGHGQEQTTTDPWNNDPLQGDNPYSDYAVPQLNSMNASTNMVNAGHPGAPIPSKPVCGAPPLTTGAPVASPTPGSTPYSADSSVARTVAPGSSVSQIQPFLPPPIMPPITPSTSVASGQFVPLPPSTTGSIQSTPSISLPQAPSILPSEPTSISSGQFVPIAPSETPSTQPRDPFDASSLILRDEPVVDPVPMALPESQVVQQITPSTASTAPSTTASTATSSSTATRSSTATSSAPSTTSSFPSSSSSYLVKTAPTPKPTPKPRGRPRKNI